MTTISSEKFLYTPASTGRGSPAINEVTEQQAKAALVAVVYFPDGAGVYKVLEPTRNPETGCYPAIMAVTFSTEGHVNSIISGDLNISLGNNNNEETSKDRRRIQEEKGLLNAQKFLDILLLVNKENYSVELREGAMEDNITTSPEEFHTAATGFLVDAIGSKILMGLNSDDISTKPQMPASVPARKFDVR